MLLLCACAALVTPRLNTDIKTLRPGQYALDKQHTTVLFKVNHLGFSQFVGRFDEVDAALDFDAAHIENSRLEATVNMKSVDVNDRAFEETLRGGDWFDTDRFPQAVFETTSVSGGDGNTKVFNGNLTFLGVTAPITVTVTFNGGANNLLTGRYTLGFSASATFKRSAFGMDQYVPAVGDDIELEMHAEFQRN